MTMKKRSFLDKLRHSNFARVLMLSVLIGSATAQPVIKAEAEQSTSAKPDLSKVTPNTLWVKDTITQATDELRNKVNSQEDARWWMKHFCISTFTKNFHFPKDGVTYTAEERNLINAAVQELIRLLEEAKRKFPELDVTHTLEQLIDIKNKTNPVEAYQKEKAKQAIADALKELEQK